MSEAKIITINGWALDASTDEPRIRDIDLAERLGHKRPRNLRLTIKGFKESGVLPGVDVRCSQQRTSMPRGGEREEAVTEYWLTEAEALFVIAKSTTPVANAITREVIDVFLAWRRGHLKPAPVPAPVDVAALVKATVQELLASRLGDGAPTIGPSGARRVSMALSEQAANLAVAMPALSRQRHRAQADAMLRRQLGWSWQPWHLYPSADLARLEAALHAGRGYARRLAKAAIRAGQLGLPGVH